MEWVGQTTGTLSSGSFSSISMQLLGSFGLGGVRAAAEGASTYTVLIDDVEVGSAYAESGTVVEVTFDAVQVFQGAKLTIESDIPTQRRYSSPYTLDGRARLLASPELGSWVMRLEMLLGPFEPQTWEVVPCGSIDGAPVAMPGVVVNGGAGGGAPSPLPLFGRERAPGPR